MAEEHFRDQEPAPAGIPTAFGGTLHRPAKGHQACFKEAVLKRFAALTKCTKGSVEAPGKERIFGIFQGIKLHKAYLFHGIIVSAYRRALMAENMLDKMPTEYLVQMIDTQKQLIESQSSQIEQLTQTIANLTETVRQLGK